MIPWALLRSFFWTLMIPSSVQVMMAETVELEMVLVQQASGDAEISPVLPPSPQPRPQNSCRWPPDRRYHLDARPYTSMESMRYMRGHLLSTLRWLELKDTTQATSSKDMASDQTKAQATKATDTFCVLNSRQVNNYTCQVTIASDHLITLIN